MRRARGALGPVAVLAAGALFVSGGSGADPETPAGLPGMPPPFLATAIVGGGRLTAAVDAYGNVVDLRARPGGPPLIDNPWDRQAAGTVPSNTGIVPRVAVEGGPALPLWRAERVTQGYLAGTNVVRTVARLRGVQVVVRAAATAGALAIKVRVQPLGEGSATPKIGVSLRPPAGCWRRRDTHGLALICSAERELLRQLICSAERELLRRPGKVAAAAIEADRRWLRRAVHLGEGAPPWAQQMYERSLLVLRALTDSRSGAAVAGARDGWAYVWPRDAATVALAFHASGYRLEARRIARFLLDLDLAAAARFDGGGAPVPGRGPQGDASGWVAVAARAAGLEPPPRLQWRGLPDYQEGEPGDYLGNAIASGGVSAIDRAESPRGLVVRQPGDPASGLDSAAAWAVRPFSWSRLHPAVRRFSRSRLHPAVRRFSRSRLYAAVRKTLNKLSAARTRFGIAPGEAWDERDPWTAPTAWTAWSLAALGERRGALQLMHALRRGATPAGALPERVDVRTGVPRSTTPLAWSHAFAILALRELWPAQAGDRSR